MGRRALRLTGLLAALSLAGCGGDDKPDMTPGKSGAVTKAVQAARGETMIRSLRLSRPEDTASKAR